MKSTQMFLLNFKEATQSSYKEDNCTALKGTQALRITQLERRVIQGKLSLWATIQTKGRNFLELQCTYKMLSGQLKSIIIEETCTNTLSLEHYVYDQIELQQHFKQPSQCQDHCIKFSWWEMLPTPFLLHEFIGKKKGPQNHWNLAVIYSWNSNCLTHTMWNLMNKNNKIIIPVHTCLQYTPCTSQ